MLVQGLLDDEIQLLSVSYSQGLRQSQTLKYHTYTPYCLTHFLISSTMFKLSEEDGKFMKGDALPK